MKVTSQSRAIWTAAVALPLLFVALAVTQMHIDAAAPPAAQQQDDLILRSPSAIQKMSLGYDSLMADIYWTRAVQYYGARFAKHGAKFDLLWPLLDITTTLDPNLIIAYRFGAVFLSESGAGGAGRPDLAVDLVKRGIAANPDDWHLNMDLGFLYYYRLKDYSDAANAFLDGSKKPNAPSWLPVMAARVAQKGGSLETSRLIWSGIYESNKDPDIRKRALSELEGLKAAEDEEQLNQLADQYQQRFGHRPGTMQDLQSAGLLQGAPVDPEGFPYFFGLDGQAQLSPDSPVVIPPAMQDQPKPKSNP
jgi:hypothetical protein